MSLSKSIKKIRARLVRYAEWNGHCIEIDSLQWAGYSNSKWTGGEKATIFQSQEGYPPLTRQAVNKLLLHPDYQVLKLQDKSFLICKYVKVQRPPRLRYFGRHDKTPNTPKQFSRKKLAKAKTKAKLEARLKRENRGKDPYGFKGISNTAFGHPKRMKAFNLQDKTNERNERAHKERNIPSLSDN